MIALSGRTGIDEYMEQSGVRESSELKHHPFLIFIESPNQVEVRVIRSLSELLTYPRETKVMFQWGGQWSSDFFQSTIQEIYTYLDKNPPKGHQFL